MGVQIQVTTEDFSGNEDRSWARTKLGFDQCRTITLDVSTFLAAHLTAKGSIPSGTLLGKITANGKYGPYVTAGSDGREVCAGLLFNTTRVGRYPGAVDLATAADVGAPLLWMGVVSQSRLPAFTGTTDGEVDAPARADLPTIRWEA